ncbi:hypothetical protein EDD22DRAFT_756366, partial [Suillus occidentalis]
ASKLERVLRQKKEKELDQAMDLLINANYCGVGCWRKVFNIQFDNGSVGETFLTGLIIAIIFVLEDWRDQKTVEIYGCSHLIDLGPTVVMGNLVLDWIIGCAHFQKIKVADDLCKETHWSINDNLAKEVITII